MKEEQWRNERDDRTLLYAKRRLDPNRWTALTAPFSHVERYDCQVWLLTAANLLSRMSPSVALSFPDTPVHPALPWTNGSLHNLILSQMRAADPFGKYEVRPIAMTDYRMHFGPEGAHSNIIHGSGWNTYLGPSPSPLPESEDTNPFGPAFAAVVAASQLFVHDFSPPKTPITMNALTWREELAPANPPVPQEVLGDIWVVGAGSVGTASLYFLVLANRPFRSMLIDMDRVKRWNLNRSPIFSEADVGQYKVDVAKAFLEQAGITDVKTQTAPLHEVEAWSSRRPGTPDVMISAANEQNVRYHIESMCPPVQLYGTTGRNWQFSLIRHIPLVEACSCCLFPPDAPSAPMACATVPPNPEDTDQEQADAALPFLSFGAGLMTAADILKLSLPGYPFTPNNVSLATRPKPRLSAFHLPQQQNCICRQRSEGVHRKMIKDNRYATLSDIRVLA